MAGMGKVKALQIWCRNRVLGYRDVEITNMTSSWRDGLGFCALIHRFRPDLIDFESLSKEDIFENNELAFEVAEGLGIPALLDAEDMVKLQTPDKLSIITYVAQLHNYFRDKEPVGGPDIKMPSKRHSTPVQRSVTMRSPESKRKPSPTSKSETQTISPTADICIICDGKVYLIEKHIADGKLYHRSCFKRNNRKTDTSALISPPKETEPARPFSRPSVLSSNGLSSTKPSTSLPATPSTPTDSRPEWQRRIQDKSVRKNISNVINRMSSPQMEPLKEVSDAAPSSGPTWRTSTPHLNSTARTPVTPKATLAQLPKTEAERVVLRTKPHNPALTKSPMPRAVSVGVDLDERIAKLRQLRASAKASSAANTAAVKARLEKIKAMAATGNLSNSDGSGKNNNSQAESPREVERASEAMDTEPHEIEVKQEITAADPATTHSTGDLGNSSDTESQDLKAAGVAEAKVSECVSKPDPVETFEEGECVTANEDGRPAEILSAPAVGVHNTSHVSEGEEITPSGDLEPANAEAKNDIGAEHSEAWSEVSEINTAAADKPSANDSGEATVEPVTKADDISLIPVEPVSVELSPAATVEPTLTEVGPVSTTVEPTPATLEPAATVAPVITVNSSTTTVETPTAQISSNTSIQISTTPSAPVRHRRSQGLKSATSKVPTTSSPVTKLSSHVTESAGKSSAADECVTASPARLPLGSLSITGKSPKPARPPVSPAITKRLQSRDTDSSHSHGDSTCKTPVVMRNSANATKPTPPRPHTVAAGPVAKSHFYMDETHKNVVEPPPKPARQPNIIQAAVTKAKDSWEDSLANWSSKRKDPTSTWYAAETYPTENNPFGEDEEEVLSDKPNENQNNAQLSTASGSKSQYDSSLNPFGDEGEDDSEIIVENRSKTEKANDQNTENLSKKKIIPFNPFEVSDDDDEDLVEVDNTEKKKIIPEKYPSAEKPKSRVHSKIILPDTTKKATPKKKVAPPPPQTTSEAPPPASQTLLISPAVVLTDKHTELNIKEEPKSREIADHKTENVNTPTIKIIEVDNSPFSELDEEENLTSGVQRKKHRPAPPRPLPPKRRVQSEYGFTPEDISKELAAIDVKQQQLEEKGRQLEQAIRTADEAMADSQDSNTDDDELLSSWLETVNEKNHLVRRESELVFIAKHHDLETKQADIEWELRQIMHQAESLKTDEDKLHEEELLQQLVTAVHERSKLVDKMDDERLRQQEEDQKINHVLGAKLGQGSEKSRSPKPSDRASKSSTDKKADKKKNKKDKKSK